MKKVNTIKQAVDLFINNCELNNLSEKTMDIYSNWLIKLESAGISELNQLDNLNIQYYTQYLKKQGYSTTTINIALRSVRAFTTYLKTVNLLNDPITIKLIKKDYEVKPVLTDEQIKQLLLLPTGRVSYSQLTAWVSVVILANTGCRINTLLELKISDIDLNSKIIKLNLTKNNNIINVPLSDYLSGSLVYYLRQREKHGINSDYFAVSSTGTRMTRQCASMAINRYASKILRNTINLNPHMLRRQFVTTLLSNNVDVITLTKLTGHASVDTIKKHYHNPSTGNLRETLNTKLYT